MKPQIILDASALLALIYDEKGAEKTQKAINAGAAMSSVNLAEVYSKLVREGEDLEDIEPEVRSLGFQVFPFGIDEAHIAGEIFSYNLTKLLRRPLSLGDRACLACGIKRSMPVLTAEQEWKKLKLQIDVYLIR